VIVVEASLPKLKYESKVENILSNTKLERADAILPKKLREEREKEKEVKQKRITSRKEKRAADREEENKKEKAPDNSMTLFVRNIPFDIDQTKFQE
jgi:RNA recognition motif-containing protein